MKRFFAAFIAIILLSGCASPFARTGTTVARPVPPVSSTPAPAPQPVSETVRAPHTPVEVHGLYMTGYIAGGDKSFHELLSYMKQSGLNAVVIDVKDDDGMVTFKVDDPSVQASGANRYVKVADMPGRIKELHDNNIYVIGRIVTMVDPVLAAWHPDWAVHVNGQLYRDGRHLPWADPTNKNVWDYNVGIAKDAAKAGFDEIQFDYVRYPEKHIQGLNYGVGEAKRVETIGGFLKYAHDQLEPMGVFVSADVFGLTTTVVDDMMIGQDYRTVAQTVDYISPMMYPSHYNNGIYGLKDPNAEPYETVYHSMLDGEQKAAGLDIKKNRPWIQDFSLRGVHYGKAEVEAQIKALANAGVRQFILWDPNNKYTRGVDYSLIDSTPELPKPAPKTGDTQTASGGTAATSASGTAGTGTAAAGTGTTPAANTTP